MRSIILALILLSFSSGHLTAQSFVRADSLVVWAPSGLKMRTGPSFDSSAIKVLPYGTVLDPRAAGELNVKLITGDSRFSHELGFVLHYPEWIRVEIEDTIGFVHGSYVTSLPVPLRSDTTYLAYLQRIGVSGDILPNSFSRDQHYVGRETVTPTSNGVVMSEGMDAGGAVDFTNIYLPLFTMHDAGLMVEILEKQISKGTLQDRKTLFYNDRNFQSYGGPYKPQSLFMMLNDPNACGEAWCRLTRHGSGVMVEIEKQCD